MAVMGSAVTGTGVDTDRSMAVEYTLERVLNDVGDRGLTTAARVREVRTLGPVDKALIWRESRGLLGGLLLDIVEG